MEHFNTFFINMKTSLIPVLFIAAVTTQARADCHEGFQGDFPDCVDVDECEMMPSICGDAATCLNTNGSFFCQCAEGYEDVGKGSQTECLDINECSNHDICGPNAQCQNTIPSYFCNCDLGFKISTGKKIFKDGNNFTCTDIDECQMEGICGPNASCSNTHGGYYCLCNPGFRSSSGLSNFTETSEECKDICSLDKTICGNGTCHQGDDGHYCACYNGFTNFGNKKSICSELNCGVFEDVKNLERSFTIIQDPVMQLNKTCLELRESETVKNVDAKSLLKHLMSIVNELLSSKSLNEKRKISVFLDLMHHVLKLVGPLITPPGKKLSSANTEIELFVDKGAVVPKGSRALSSKHAKLEVDLEVAAGDADHYPGFTTVSMLTYANLEDYAHKFFSGMKPERGQSYKLNSKVVTVTVSNRNTSHLEKPIILTLFHLEQTNATPHACVFWDSLLGGGTWSPIGCNVVESNRERTVCSCNHLSSFAVLMALYEVENDLALQLMTWVGLSLSLLCLFFCILTFSLIRSIQSPRTTIHLHLCISLFIAILIFLCGISQTDNRVGCGLVAGMLHFFYLAAFCWMCLEGIQLFRMVVLVFHTNFKTLYMLAGGYGVPAGIVALTAIINPKGYGTEKYCWLSLDSIWSFFGPACVIILVNIFFFLITVWKLAQKFSSLNPDLNNLQKIKTFTVTAVAQLCILGTMWIFGCFQFEKGTIVMSYLFTIFGSLQGVMLFVMHCLFSKQVRDEYERILSKICAPEKKKYFEYSNSHSSKANGSRSTQDTGESHI